MCAGIFEKCGLLALARLHAMESPCEQQPFAYKSAGGRKGRKRQRRRHPQDGGYGHMRPKPAHLFGPASDREYFEHFLLFFNDVLFDLFDLSIHLRHQIVIFNGGQIDAHVHQCA